MQCALGQRLEELTAACEEQESARDGVVDEGLFEMAFQLAQATSKCLQVPVHDEQGHLTPESAAQVESARWVLPAQQEQEARDAKHVEWDQPVTVVTVDEGWIDGATLLSDTLCIGYGQGAVRLWTLDAADVAQPIRVLEQTKPAWTHWRSDSPSQSLSAVQTDGRVRTGTFFGGQVNLLGSEVRLPAHKAVALTGHGIWTAAEGRVTLTSPQDGQVLGSVAIDMKEVDRMAVFAVDTFALGDIEGTIHLYRRGEGTPVVLDDHSGRINDLAFSPDGRHLLSASEDRTARLWDVRKGLWRQELRWQRRYADRVAFTADGRLFAVAYADGSVGIWETETGDILNLLVSVPQLCHSFQGKPWKMVGIGGKTIEKESVLVGIPGSMRKTAGILE